MLTAAIQHDIVWERPEDNFERLAPKIAEAAAGGARLVALTEMYSTGFSMFAAESYENTIFALHKLFAKPELTGYDHLFFDY